MNHLFLFFIFLLLGLYLGRKIGWWISKMFLYILPINATIAICLVWGITIAIISKIFLEWTQPGIILKIIGYGAGAYLSFINYALIAEETIPTDKMKRHVLIEAIPFTTFVIISIILAFAKL